MTLVLLTCWLQPKRLDEQERLRAVDGRVFHHNGMRVYGIHNISQSPGDLSSPRAIASPLSQIFVTRTVCSIS